MHRFQICAAEPDLMLRYLRSSVSTRKLRRPNIFPYAFDPVPQLVYARIPILQPHPHVINLLHIQHFWLDPIDPRDLCHLVNTPPQQPQAQRLHNQNLNLFWLHMRLPRDRCERHRPIVWRPAEYRLCKCGERNLLPQEGFVLL